MKRKPNHLSRIPEHGSFWKRPGYIYVLESAHGYKIGRSKNFPQRTSQINLLLPFEITLIHVIRAKDCVLAEWLIHELFADLRIKGEWFNLCPEDVSFLKSMGSSEAYQSLYGLIEDIPIIQKIETTSEEVM